MRARLSAAGTLCILLAGLVEGGQPQPLLGSKREVVYFGPAGPQRLGLYTLVDGRAVDEAWNEAVSALFNLCDRNGDGFLDAAERAAFVEPVRRRGNDVLAAIDGRPEAQPLRLTFPQKDDRISRQAFLEAFRASSNGAINFRVTPVRSESQQLSAALFRLLDQNGDSRLSIAELKAARERLAVLDVDEDEYISAEELLGTAVGLNGGPRIVRPPMRQADRPADGNGDLVFLSGEGMQAVKQLLAARAGPRATSLKKTEFGGEGKLFAALDQDGNGVLDTTELAAWLSQKPALELSYKFTSSESASMALVPWAGPQGRGAQFRFEPGEPSRSQEWGQTANRLREQLKELAKDTGVVERKQVENQSALLAFFEMADHNGDGKLEAAEIEAALKVLAPLTSCRVDYVFEDRGAGLFELLDRNNDGRLSPRELADAVDVLKPFAHDDGSVGPGDLVRRFVVHPAVEPIPIGVLLPPTRPVKDTGAPSPKLPTWFTRMDRNGDGEVSLREFVGPLELFHKLDRNGDGLISPDEALAAESGK
jgi:Ca2+-binding EF-hand superfamily protein